MWKKNRHHYGPNNNIMDLDWKGEQRNQEAVTKTSHGLIVDDVERVGRYDNNVIRSVLGLHNLKQYWLSLEWFFERF